MDKIAKIIREAEIQCNRVWLSAAIITSELNGIRKAFDRQNDLSADQIAQLKVLESELINKKPGWQ